MKKPIVKTVFKGGVSAKDYAAGLSKKLGKTIKPGPGLPLKPISRVGRFGVSSWGQGHAWS